ncbi:MAG: L-fucose/L-arabinose isomerase family protein [Patescibacteria group bacterium]|jgi:L-fucose isomerase-like protein
MIETLCEKQTIGLIVANRGFFPDWLVREGRIFMKALLKRLGYNVIVLSDQATKFGGVETWEDAKKCAALFKAHPEISGVIVTLPNFGDERGIADALRLAGINVPILMHAWSDVPGQMGIKFRRDSFCGKMSACNALVQYGIPFTLTRQHTMDPTTAEFEQEIAYFAAVCRVVNGLRGCRVGALGARPAAFTTVRYSEKLLQEAGISVETLDLSEVFGRIDKLTDTDGAVRKQLAAIGRYIPCTGVPAAALMKMAKLAVVIDRWIAEAELNITAVQCWTSMETYFGVVPCTVMSMLSQALKSSACEVDVMGAVAMHSLALASQTPSALVDWNDNFGSDPDKCVVFHCSNLPRHCFSACRMSFQEIIAGTVGEDNAQGTVVGRMKPGAVTVARLSTFDNEGVIGGYVGEGRITDDNPDTFGGAGVLQIADLQELLAYICRNGFEHHVALSYSDSARAVREAWTKYMKWPTRWHNGPKN